MFFHSRDLNNENALMKATHFQGAIKPLHYYERTFDSSRLE